MPIRIPPAWHLAEREATPQSVYLDRRRLLRGLGIAGFAGLGASLAGAALAATATPAPSAPVPPPAAPPPAAVASNAAGVASTTLVAPRNQRYTLDRPLTAAELPARFNVFDEFSVQHDQVWKLVAGFRTDPWKVHFGGAVEKEQTFEAGELARRLGLEERLYRHRCVETWAMAVPWIGFPLARLVELAKPLAAARYLRMVTVARPEQMPGFYDSRRVFPYYEGLSLGEATHELAFVATGIYGQALPAQHGAPLRLVVPWKYGFKSIKSIVAFQFTRERPGTFWNELAPHIYSFESNVDPKGGPGDQSTETMLGTEEKRPTQPFNGYGELVAKLYG